MELYYDAEETAGILRGHTVGDVLMRDVPVIDDNATIKEAACRLLNSQNKNFLVLREGMPMGTVTRRDIIRALHRYGESARLAKAVVHELEYLPMGMPLEEAWTQMQNNQRPMALVVDDGRLKGAVDEESIEAVILLQTAQSHN